MAAKYEFPAPDPSVNSEQHDLDGFWVRSYTPPGSTGQEPLGVYFHGGGWVMGSVDQEDAVCRLISKACKMRMVSVEYRMAPKHKYPVPLQDCVTATLWTLKHFSQDKALLLGGSAGANLAFGTALKLIDQGQGDRVKGVVAMVPVTVLPDALPAHLKPEYTAYDQHANHTVNTKSAMEVFISAYGAPQDCHYTSCLLHPRLRDLPKTYITESSTDTLRDDARLMKAALEMAGVPVRYDAYPGFPHYSWTFPSKHLAGHQADFFGKLIEAVTWINEPTSAKL